MSVTLVHWKHMQRNGVKRFRSAPNLWIFVKEVFEVVGEVNDALLHLGDAAPPIELNFAEELWVVCHLQMFQSCVCHLKHFSSQLNLCNLCNLSPENILSPETFFNSTCAPELQLVSLKHISSDLVGNVGKIS